jgi:hypothetical protein
VWSLAVHVTPHMSPLIAMSLTCPPCIPAPCPSPTPSPAPPPPPPQILLLSLLDLPFSISPVVTGLMLTLLYGRSGWFAGWLAAHGWNVVFAFPGEPRGKARGGGGGRL